ncbi:MAG: hypothetical protein JWO13_844 [Acidobacteriales bacterium]|nr:hypothetical protein [Terriglobales bacterium]
MSLKDFHLFASPWWVNLLLLVPFICFWSWRKRLLAVTFRQLALAAIFAAAFGFVEASVVVYLRAASGLLPGYQGTLADVIQHSQEQPKFDPKINELPRSLVSVEVFREAATILMLASVAVLVGRTRRETFAAFLWVFAIWDITYYAGLWATIRWPVSLLSWDVLFLIPEPWISQVWFPLLVSSLTLLAVMLRADAEAQD